MRKVSEATFVDFGLVGSKGDCYTLYPDVETVDIPLPGSVDQDSKG